MRMNVFPLVGSAACVMLALLSAPLAAEDVAYSDSFPAPDIGIAEVIGSDIVGSEMLGTAGDAPTPGGESLYSEPQDGSLLDSRILTSGPEWMSPTRWFSEPIWEPSLELGINGSEGNAQAFSLLASGKIKRETDRSTMLTDIVYSKTEAASILTQHYAFLNTRVDWKLGESPWSIFKIARVEYDEFKIFDLRLALNAGLGYAFIDNDFRKLKGRFGAGASREIGGGDESWVPEAVFGVDYEHKISDRQRLEFTSDYYPSWADFKDYRLVTKASWELLLDEETNLSLKVGVLDRYDSTPFGLKPNDLDYFVTLLWKM